jgi:outer membrane protein TolC
LFDGFRTNARLAQSRQDAEMARLRLERLRSDLKSSLEQSASNLRIANGAAELALLEVQAAEEKLKTEQALLEAGRAEIRELETARGQLLEKRIAAVAAEKARFERQVVLLQAGGALSSAF